MKAWRTEVMGIVSLVVTETRNKAMTITWRAANNAGYVVMYHYVSARRAPAWDSAAERLPNFLPNRCLPWPEGRPVLERRDAAAENRDSPT